ncbi:unnamed protein product [Protopolystoma xenopodis]|uniref:Antolefinin Antolefinine n=1 Tax=Protopolystoma xenopodis TaxID=117903 RepID=A0A3S5CCF9_9PLAT|nr:unnamed protein product [Protopolystoma xenopodis]
MKNEVLIGNIVASQLSSNLPKVNSTVQMAANWDDRAWWPDRDDADISYARDKLDQLLQTLKDNPNRAKESSRYKDEILGRRESQEKEKFRPSFFKTSPNDSKRRKRRAGSDEEEGYKGSLLEIFERSVDFSQFTENAPLYPMARAWIRNLNQGDASSWNDIPNADDDLENTEQLPECHYALPKPMDGLTDNEVRVPPPLPSIGQPFVINVEDPPKEMSPEGLLEQHISRWREIRRKWKSACRYNEERYMDAYLILKEMYDKYCKEIS